MVASTIAGAEYGITLVWALAAGVVVKMAITEGGARWQLATGTTLVEGWRNHLPRAGVLAFFLLRGQGEGVQMTALVFVSGLYILAAVEDMLEEAHDSADDTRWSALSFLGGFAVFLLVSAGLGG